MGWHIVHWQFIPGRAKVVIVARAFSVEDGDTNVVVQS